MIGAADERVLLAQYRTIYPGRAGRQDRIVALDLAGEVVWRRHVKRGLLFEEQLKVVDDMLLLPTAREPGLRAWRVDDGSPVWEAAWEGEDLDILEGADLNTLEGADLNTLLDDAELVDGRLLVPGTGLREIDVGTGEYERVVGAEVDVEDVAVGEQAIALQTEIGIAVYDRR